MPYGSDYRIRPRKIWGPDEPTFSEGLGRGISNFIKQKRVDDAAGDEWENQVSDAGGEVTPQESTMDRLRGIGNTIRRHLPGYDATADAEGTMASGKQPGDFVQATPSRGGAPFDERLPAPTRPGRRMVLNHSGVQEEMLAPDEVGPMTRDANSFYARSNDPGGDVTLGGPQADPGFVRRPPPGSPDPGFSVGGFAGGRVNLPTGRGAPPARGVAGLISEQVNEPGDTYIAKGPGGRSATMLTAQGRQRRDERLKIAAEARARSGRQDEFGYEAGITHKNRMEEIAATPRSTPIDADEWDRRESVRARNAANLKGTPGAPSTAGDLGERRLRASTLRSAISAAQAIIPKNPFDRRSAMRDPEQARRITEAERQVDEATKELNTLALPEDRKVGGDTPEQAPPEERAHNATAPVEVMKQRAQIVKADALKKFPKASPAAVAAYVRNVMKREGWSVQ